MLLIRLFLSFVKIGLLGFGGGMAITGLIQQEVEAYGWMSSTEFVDIVAISQMTPGPVGINMATYTGYTACLQAGMPEWMCIVGSLVATTAIVLPSLVIMLIISRLYFRISGRWAENKVYQYTMLAIRAVVLFLIGQAAVSLMSAAGLTNVGSIAIFASVLVLALLPMIYNTRITQQLSHPILLIVLSGIAGFALSYI